MADWVDAVAVVTGAASGIGRSLALAAAARGARVAVVDIQAERAALVAEEIAAGGGEARAYACDVADAAEVAALAGRIEADFGGVNLLVNNAGVVVGGAVEATRALDAQWMFAVNVMGVLNGVQAFLPLLREARAAGKLAYIVNTGSENSLGVPVIGPTSVYTATKHAVLGLTDALRRDLAGSGIGVSILCPGLVHTNILEARGQRQDRFGGPKYLDPARAKQIRASMGSGQHPDFTARLCMEGIDSGAFMIVTDPDIRAFAERRHREVEAALDGLDVRLAAEKHEEHLV